MSYNLNKKDGTLLTELVDGILVHPNTLCITTSESGGDEEHKSCNIFNKDIEGLLEFNSEDGDPDIFHGMVGLNIKLFDNKKSENLIAIRPITKYEKEKAISDEEGNPIETCEFAYNVFTDIITPKNIALKKEELMAPENSVEYEVDEIMKDEEIKNEIRIKSCKQLKCYGFSQKILEGDNDDVCKDVDHPGIPYDKCEEI